MGDADGVPTGDGIGAALQQIGDGGLTRRDDLVRDVAQTLEGGESAEEVAETTEDLE